MLNYFEKLLKFVSIRPRSVYEVKSWCRRKKVDPKIQAIVLEKLKELEFLDDYKFSLWWIDQRLSFRPKSKRLLKLELLKKGVNREIIQKALESVEIDEAAVAKNLIYKKEKRWKRLDEIEKKKKIINFLKSRGFNWEIIRRVIN
ncbi:MAG: RecX family transcriptional regulator [Candidatus Woesebacteria bacterium]|nr:MAG: RecX family transcriptional regulator [Candidatus Woesebacteria bacterium]